MVTDHCRTSVGDERCWGCGIFVVRGTSSRARLTVFFAVVAVLSTVPSGVARAEEVTPAGMMQDLAARPDQTADERSIWAEHMRGRDRSRRQQEDNPPLISFVVMALFIVVGIWGIRWLGRLITRRGSGGRSCPGCRSSMPYGADYCPRCRTISLPNGNVISRR